MFAGMPHEHFAHRFGSARGGANRDQPWKAAAKEPEPAAGLVAATPGSGVRFAMRACAAARIFCGRSCFSSPTEYGPPGFASTSTAPHCSASIAVWLEDCASELITTTGSGWKRISFFKKRQAVHARHLDIQRQHVRPQAQDLVARDKRIGRGAHYFQIRLRRQAFGQHLAHDGRIVHDQHSDFAICRHAIVTPAIPVRRPHRRIEIANIPSGNQEASVQRFLDRPTPPWRQLRRR